MQFVGAAPANLNCGGDTLSVGAQVYLADREYTPANGAGSVGGQPYSLPAFLDMEPIEGTASPDLYATTRTAPSEYRFDLPNGRYIVTLDFIELDPIGPRARSFSVTAEGRVLLPDLDIYAVAGKHYALRYRFLVPVQDRQLNIGFTPTAGVPAIAGIGVSPALSDSVPPAVPQVTARGGYNRNILNWPDAPARDLAGYVVYRAATAAGPYTRLTPSAVPFSRYFDDAVTAGQTRFYRVSSVDVFGNESFASLPVSARTRHASESALPVYELTLAPDQLAQLENNPFSDEYVDGDFSHAGELYPDIGVRLRGSISRFYNKKSWRVNFKSSKPFKNRDKLNTKAVAVDVSLIRECLGAFVLRPLSVFAGDCNFVHLQVNSEFKGVFAEVEIPDQDFLRARGLDVRGKLFEASDAVLGNFRLLDDYGLGWEDDSAEEEGFAALADFVQLINNTPDKTFATTISSVLNVDAWLDYYAGIMLMGNFDHTGHNYYAFRDPATNIWEILPKDHDTSFYFADLPLNYGTQAAPDRMLGHYNILADRILAVPLFRQMYVAKMNELLATDFTMPRLNVAAGLLHARVRQDALVDVYKRFRESNAEFLASTEEIRQFVEWRRTFVRQNLPALSPGIAQTLVMNEVVTRNENGIRDEAQERSPWIEIFNRGNTPRDLTGHYLTDDPRNSAKWQFPTGTTIAARGHLLVWVDGQPAQGPNHTSFALNAAGGTILLFGPSDGASKPLLDVIAYRSLAQDVAYGRRFSGSALWRPQQPTPGAGNTSQALD